MKTHETKKHIRNLETEIEALLIAIVREVASHEFYKDLIKKHKGTRAADIFRELARQETSHKEQLDGKLAELRADLKDLRQRHASRKKNRKHH
jgi:rubrerythrin